MSCEAEQQAVDEATRRARDLEIEVQLAMRRAKGGLLGAAGACVLEIGGGAILGIGGVIAGSAACAGGLLGADSLMGDLDAARRRLEDAHEDMADAMLDYVKCGFRRDAEPAVS